MGENITFIGKVFRYSGLQPHDPLPLFAGGKYFLIRQNTRISW